MNDKVVAIVVTYNRKELLVRCIDALLAQTHPLHQIILIDNASTDGTNLMLGNLGYLNHPKIDYRLMSKNTGGAGGFNSGVAAAMAGSPDWMWLMDDDGWPASDCLYELLHATGYIRGPMVIDDQDLTQTSFAYKSNGIESKDVSILGKCTDLLPVHPFNGVLLSTEVISNIGLPDARFFIWGDEIDYRSRWLAAGYTESVKPAARFFHPSDRQVVFRSNSKSLGVPLQCSNLRRYCFYRNQTNLAKRRIGVIKALGKVVFTLPDAWSSEKDKWLFITAVIHGLLGIFGHHTKFIK